MASPEKKKRKNAVEAKQRAATCPRGPYEARYKLLLKVLPSFFLRAALFWARCFIPCLLFFSSSSPLLALRFLHPHPLAGWALCLSPGVSCVPVCLLHPVFLTLRLSPTHRSPTPPNKGAYTCWSTHRSVPSLPPHRHPHAVPSDTSPRGCQLRRKEEKHPHVCDPPCPCPMRNAPPRLHFGILSAVCPTNRTLFCSSLQPMLSLSLPMRLRLPCRLSHAHPAVPSPMSVSTSVCPSGALPAAHPVPQHP